MLVGLGHGLLLNAQNFATQAIAVDGEEAQAAAMYTFLRSFGLALGVGIGGSVFQNVAKIRLQDFDLPSTIAQNVEVYAEILREGVSLDAEQARKIIEAFSYGITGVYGVMCGIAGIGLVASFFIGHFDLDKALMTEHKLGENKLTQKLGRSSHVAGG